MRSVLLILWIIFVLACFSGGMYITIGWWS